MKRMLICLLLLAAPLSAQYINAPSQMHTLTPAINALNVQMGPYNALPTTLTDQTGKIQGAINDACAVQDLNGNNAPPIVFIPGGTYAFTSLTIPCSGLWLQGNGIKGGSPASSTALCSTLSSAGTMLTIGSLAVPVGNVHIDGIVFSGFCGGFPAGIEVFCNRCLFTNMSVTGYSVFGIRFLGQASNGSGGFSTVENSEIANGQANSFAFVIVTQGGSGGGPDGQTFLNNYVNTANGWINDSTVAGATQLRSSQAFIGNKFNGVNAGAITALTGQTDTDRFTNNRFENTGTGSITVLLNNTTTTNMAAIFTGNLWACGPGNCSWTDNSTVKAVRVSEVMGPSNTPMPPGILFRSSSATASGAGSPATLKTFTVNANTLAADRTQLRVRVWGTGANNANAKAVRVEFGGVVLITIPLTVSVAAPWKCDVNITFRVTGSAAQSVGGDCVQGTTATVATVTTTTPTLDFTVANAVRVTVTQVAAADVTQDGMLVEFIQ